jgi:ribosomal-protein-alanine N-acetyltransferase
MTVQTEDQLIKLSMQSERLAIRPFDANDTDIVVQLFTDPEVRRYTGGAMTVEEVQQGTAASTKRGGDGSIGIWCLEDRTTGEKLGTVALLPMPVDEKQTNFSLVEPGFFPDCDIEIGYFLKPGAWGRGLATEACKRILRFAFELSELTEIAATCDPGNVASRNVLIKAGFSDCGLKRSYGQDGPYFRITRDEWSKQRMRD